MAGPEPSLHRHARAVAFSGAVLGIASALVPYGLTLRATRIDRGHAVSLFQAFGAPWTSVLIACWLLVATLALMRGHRTLRGAVASLAAGMTPVIALWRSGAVALDFTERAGDLARVSLGLGFWLTAAAAYIAIFAATAWLERGLARAVVSYIPFAGVAAVLASGSSSHLGIAREYANNTEAFSRQLSLHLGYVGVSVGFGLLLGLLLGLLASRRPAAEPIVFGTLNVLQVIPTLAFVGLMYPLLTALSRSSDVFAALGVRGVGWAPVVIVLSSYAVYPIARNTHAALASIEPSVVDAAEGIGMSAWQRLARVEIPLALPVILAGLRVALVQSTAGAIIAGLIGGGGLGTFVFLGASETASDLMLLGVVPIVGLALAFDRGLSGAEEMLVRWKGSA